MIHAIYEGYDIAASFEERHGSEIDRRVTPKWIGAMLRRKLHFGR